MSKTIDDFRNFFKPDKQKERFTVLESVQFATNLINTVLSMQNITLNQSISEENMFVYGYPHEFSQVVLNLINNSKDALLDKEIKHPYINLEVGIQNGYIAVKISDNGGGIDENIIDKVFDPYFTTKDKTKGTGLGLYMSKMIVEQNMNGMISVTNTNEGVEFVIQLPIAVNNI